MIDVQKSRPSLPGPSGECGWAGRPLPPPHTHPQSVGCCPAPLCTRMWSEGTRAEVEGDLLEIQLAL